MNDPSAKGRRRRLETRCDGSLVTEYLQPAFPQGKIEM
jgi:hypothetical protein